MSDALARVEALAVAVDGDYGPLEELVPDWRQAVLRERRGPTLWLTLNRPERLNGLNADVIVGLLLGLDEAEDPEVRSVVIAGRGRAFSAGGDMPFEQDLLSTYEGRTVAWPRWLEIANVMQARIRGLPKPVIAAVEGVAVAGGLEIMANCDLVVAGEGVRIGDAHLNYGFVPGSGEVAILSRVIGPHRLKRLLFTGEMLTAREMESWGLISSVVPDGEVVAEVERMTAAIAQRSGPAVAGLKRLIAEGLDAPLAVAIRMEWDHIIRYTLGADVQEGVAAFVEKREPAYVQPVPTVMRSGQAGTFGPPQSGAARAGDGSGAS